MAEVFTDIGLDYMLGIFPKNGAGPATLYIGLFTGATASTTPAASIVGGASPSGWTEATGTGYARQAIAAASWGSPVASSSPSGRKVTAGQVTFPAVGSGGWGTINGFFISTHSSSVSGDTPIFFANFDDLTGIPSAQSDVIKITPTIVYGA